MTKSIKFNIEINKTTIRDLDDLRKNFNMDDVWSHFYSGILSRWLEVRSLTEKMSALNQIEKVPSAENISKLAAVLDHKLSKAEVEYISEVLTLRSRRLREISDANKKDSVAKEFIGNYHKNYSALLLSIKENSGNYPRLKAIAAEIGSEYKSLFEVDYRRFFQDEIKSPIFLLVLMANSDLKYLISDDDKKSIYRHFMDLIENESESWYMEHLWNPEVSAEAQPIQSFRGTTEDYWKALEESGSIMLIHVPQGTFIRNYNKSKEEMRPDTVNEKFTFTEGLDYKSKEAYVDLIYMKV